MANQQELCHQGGNQEPDVNEATVTATTNITNIYYDCLERIFDFLDITSLFNVAQTCKRLQTAAAAKFGDEYGKKQVCLYVGGSVLVQSLISHPYISILRSGAYQYPSAIRVLSIESSLAFLRCFGAKITLLSVSYSNCSAARSSYVDRYVNQYCAENLLGISFIGKDDFLIENYQRPFKSVRAVRITESRFENPLENFSNWFPKLWRLTLDNVEILENSKSSEVHFPFLENLDLSVSLHSSMEEISLSQARSLLRANPQLESLTLNSKDIMTFNMVSSILSENLFITKLILNIRLSGKLDGFVRLIEKQQIAELELNESIMNTQKGINIFRISNSLKHFKFSTKDAFATVTQLLDKFHSECISSTHTIIRSGELTYIQLCR